MADNAPPVDDWPMPKFFFAVTIGGDTTIHCQEVTGLEQEAEVLEYRHGASPKFSLMRRAGMIKPSNITLKKGVLWSDVNQLSDIFDGLGEGKYRPESPDLITDILIELLDPGDKTPILSWSVDYAIPVKISGVDMKSDSSEIFIESIEFAVEGVTII